MPEIKKILVPCDFSKESRAAMDYACMVAEQTGASLDVLHVWDQPRYLDAQMVLQNSKERESLLDFVKAQVESEMKKFLAHPKRNEKIVVHKRYQLGVPHEQVLELARKETFDLIIMGTHGRNAFATTLLGSVAAKVIREAPCPVITIKASQEDPRKKYEHKDLMSTY